MAAKIPLSFSTEILKVECSDMAALLNDSRSSAVANVLLAHWWINLSPSEVEKANFSSIIAPDQVRFLDSMMPSPNNSAVPLIPSLLIPNTPVFKEGLDKATNILMDTIKETEGANIDMAELLSNMVKAMNTSNTSQSSEKKD